CGRNKLHPGRTLTTRPPSPPPPSPPTPSTCSPPTPPPTPPPPPPRPAAPSLPPPRHPTPTLTHRPAARAKRRGCRRRGGATVGLGGERDAGCCTWDGGCSPSEHGRRTKTIPRKN
ncbi:hypothetical protein C8J57DRAFT_1705430, partial [Mycena rebaudengoi]